MYKDEDPTVHTIYFRINEQPPFAKSGLTKFEYVQLKHDDKMAWEFIQEMYGPRFKEWNPDVDILYRSIDDVDYTRVMMPQQLLTKKKSPLVSHAHNFDVESMTSCSTVNFHNKAHNIALVADSSCSNESSDVRFQTESRQKIEQTVNSQVNKDPVNEMESAIEWNNSSIRKKSSVWTYFENKENNAPYAVCTICNAKVKHCGGTTNLRSHLARNHWLLCSGILKDKKDNTSESSSESTAGDNLPLKRKKLVSKSSNLFRIDEAFERANSYAVGGPQSDKITAALLFMIAKDKEALSIVNREGFKYLMKVVAPRYHLPDRKTLIKLMENRYVEAKECYKSTLEKALCYTLTCDNWTDCTFQSYLSPSITYLRISL